MAPKKKSNTTTQAASVVAVSAAEKAAAAAALAAATAAAAKAEAERLAREAEEERAADLANRSKGALKNLRRRQKKAEAAEQEKMAQERYDLMTEELDEKYGIQNTEIVATRNTVVASLQHDLNQAQISSTFEKIKSEADEVRRKLNALVTRCKESLNSHQGDAVAMKGSSFDPVQLLIDLRDLEEEGEDDEHIKWLESVLIQTVQWVAFLDYQKAVNAIISEANHRLSRVAGALEVARATEKQNAAAKRVAEVKGMKDFTSVGVISTESIEVSEELGHILSLAFAAREGGENNIRGLDAAHRAALNWVNKKEKETGAIFEKNPKFSRSTAIHIIVASNEVENAKAAVSKIDLSGSRAYHFDHNRSLNAIVGRAGSNIKAVEEECNVLILNQNDILSVYGSASNVDKAIKLLDEKSSTGSEEVPTKSNNASDEIAHEVTISALKARGLSTNSLRTLETKAKISNIRIRHHNATGPITEHPGDSTATFSFKSSQSNVDSATSAINQFLNKEIVSHDIPLSETQYNKLNSKFPKNRDQPLTPALRILREFTDFRNANPIHTFLRPGFLTVVGTEKEISTCRSSLDILLNRADVEQFSLKALDRDVVRSIPNIRIIRLEKEVDGSADIKAHYAKDGKQDVTLSAASSKIEELKSKYATLLKEFSHTATLKNPPSRLIGTLLARKAEGLRDLEHAHSVSVTLHRPNKDSTDATATSTTEKGEYITITGSAQGVADAEAVLKKSIEVAASVITKEVSLSPENVRHVIGPKGETIRKISAGLDRADIANKDTPNPKIVLIGQAKAVEKALDLIERAIQPRQTKKSSVEERSENVVGGGVSTTQVSTANNSSKQSGEQYPALGIASAVGVWPATATPVQE